jgi:hypothetical protein
MIKSITKLERELAKLRGQWRDQVMHDHRLSFATRVSGYYLAARITMEDTRNRYGRTGKIVIWGSQEKLAGEMGCSEETAHRAIGQLIDRGHLRLFKRGNQYTGANSYRVIVKLGSTPVK